MLSNYIKIVLRNLYRSKLYSFITIIGLAIGIACFIFIALFIKDELSYDSFHHDAHNLYRITERIENKGQGEHSSSIPFPVAKSINEQYGHIFKTCVRIFNNQEIHHAFKVNNTTYNETGIFFADSSFFDIFNYSVSSNNKSCLSGINKVVLSKELALKYFGNENPIGKEITFEGKLNLIISGVVDNTNQNSHLSFNALISFESLGDELQFLEKEWIWNPCWTYVRLQPDYSTKDAEMALENIVSQKLPKQLKKQTIFSLQPITDIHLHSNLSYEISKNGNHVSLLILATIALLVLVIAAINFINLSTARSISRAREVGIRKLNGAFRQSLFIQFLFESVILSVFSIIIALSLIEILLPSFNALSNKSFTVSDIYNTWTLCILLGIGITTGLFSGLFPSFFMSKFEPLIVLKGISKLTPESSTMRRWLVIYQFAVSIVLLICTAVIYQQLNFMQQADLGFNHDEVIVLPVRSSMNKSLPAFMDSLSKKEDIQQLTVLNDLLGRQHNTSGYRVPTIDTNNYYYFPVLFSDERVVETFNLNVMYGRGFRANQGDDTLSILVNESMLPFLGLATPKEAIGMNIMTGRKTKKIVGVIQNFHFSSLQNPIGPFVIEIPSQQYKWYFTKYIAIRLTKGHSKKTIAEIQDLWNIMLQEIPFSFSYMDDEIISQYGLESRLAKLSVYFSLLAIIIACLGLFALSAFTASQRVREIGIRKVLGASVFRITKSLSLEYVKLVFISNLIAWPIAYLIMTRWLNNFAFHISLDINMFIIASGIALVIALITVTSQSLKAALQNPIHSISYE